MDCGIRSFFRLPLMRKKKAGEPMEMLKPEHQVLNLMLPKGMASRSPS